MPAIGGVAERRYVALLATLFAIIWLGLAVEPRHRADWALENALTILALTLLVLTRRRVPLSPVSYTLIFVFLTFRESPGHLSVLRQSCPTEAAPGQTAGGIAARKPFLAATCGSPAVGKTRADSP
jgi:hypothetical protein